MNTSDSPSRREFFRACFRYPALLAMTALGVSLAARSRSATGCRDFPVCQACKLLDGCEKPPALETKKAR